MAMHNTNSLLKYVVPVVALLVVVAIVMPLFHTSKQETTSSVIPKDDTIKGTASHDSAAESLETLTAELSETKQKITEVAKTNETLKNENGTLINKVQSKQTEETSQLTNEIEQLKNQVQTLIQSKTEEYSVNNANSSQTIGIVSDLSETTDSKDKALKFLTNTTHEQSDGKTTDNDGQKLKSIPFYTIPANGTSVKDRLMTSLVGRIPVKGVVTDPYPFKIVISDDNLAANGLRVPHLLQMIVSGYCEGDLNMMSVRGWITSLTFVFDDGTISSTTSNDNDIGNFTKSNSLGYLSDAYGNPFIQGRLITNAPTYLGGNVALGVASGAANAYAQSQTTNSTTIVGGNTSSVTGSQGKFVAGQAAVSGMSEAQTWWHDRQQQSFDAIYVATIDDKGRPIDIAVNFAKEIQIDYNPKGRKLSYAHDSNARIHSKLD